MNRIILKDLSSHIIDYLDFISANNFINSLILFDYQEDLNLILNKNYHPNEKIKSKCKCKIIDTINLVNNILYKDIKYEFNKKLLIIKFIGLEIIINKKFEKMHNLWAKREYIQNMTQYIIKNKCSINDIFYIIKQLDTQNGFYTESINNTIKSYFDQFEPNVFLDEDFCVYIYYLHPNYVKKIPKSILMSKSFLRKVTQIFQNI